MNTKLSRTEIKENFEQALLRLQNGAPTVVEKDSPINVKTVAKEAGLKLKTILENKTLLSVNLGITRMYEALERFKTNDMINVPLWNKLTVRSLCLEAEVPINFVNIHKKDGTLALPKLLEAMEKVIEEGYETSEPPEVTNDDYLIAIDNILNKKTKALSKNKQHEVSYENIAAEIGKSARLTRLKINETPELLAAFEKAHEQQRDLFPNVIDRLNMALDRLIKGEPINVPKGTGITNSSVSMEAGLDKSTIRPNRPRYEAIIQRIKEANGEAAA